MARVIYPINGKTYTAEDVEIFNSPRTSGIYSVLDFDCSLSGNVLTIGKGLAWIKNGDFTGKCVAFTEPETLTLDSADSTKNRFDVVAIRYDASKTEPELVIIKGETGDIPMLPERKKETYLYELFLYAILRKAGEGSASFENLSDLRDDETFCGIMRDSVTSSVAPLYETLYDDETGMSLFDGQPIPVETDKYVSYVATVKGSDMVVEIPLYAFDGISFGKKINGKRVISTSAGDETTFLITFECFPENISISDIFWSSDTGNGQAILTKLVGITKQPEGYVKVDSVYNPESHNAQSGEAVKQAIEEALAEFEPPESDVDFLGNLRPILKAFFTNVQTLITQIAYTQDENIGSELIQNASDIVSVLEIAPPGEPEEPDEPETPEEPEEPEIDENAVNIYGGFLGMDSTIDSEPATNASYPNAACSDVIPVEYEGGASWEYDVKLNSNITDTTKINWKTYNKSDGNRHQSVNGDTLTGIANTYSTRLNILDQTATADGSNAVITGFTVTVKIGSIVKAVYEIGINDLRG